MIKEQEARSTQIKGRNRLLLWTPTHYKLQDGHTGHKEESNSISSVGEGDHSSRSSSNMTNSRADATTSGGSLVDRPHHGFGEHRTSGTNTKLCETVKPLRMKHRDIASMLRTTATTHLQTEMTQPLSSTPMLLLSLRRPMATIEMIALVQGFANPWLPMGSSARHNHVDFHYRWDQLGQSWRCPLRSTTLLDHGQDTASSDATITYQQKEPGALLSDEDDDQLWPKSPRKTPHTEVSARLELDQLSSAS